ncbi:pseudouridine synthase [Corynebacterium phocae]|uniref:tRNA pseudouridine synthase B n=1 Tax=Corynebacterium phocae TaxID=161895 RepID=A0A1L7D2M4_9CORY|nr:tRNA pseudouridine(55) synthase TruB [Corynebacterium phocae]APT92345.1 pseudouridine synthase [Corynebacterium phocae]KAA8724937.1 tRNA pseudouridine(55) synthase TruB [Corynebacterium phocae]
MTDVLATSGLVVVDKPAGMTSHDVVGALRRIFGTRKVGHAGTLDPMATGVLVAGIERGTKFLAHLVTTTKAYETTIRLGEATTTDDFEGQRTWGESAAGLSEEQVLAAVDKLTGDIMQRPASVSAIKIDGKRAHERVRDGETVDIPARPVTVSKFQVHAVKRAGDFLDIDATVECSSGTYIRSLARDMGEDLGVGGHLLALRRTEVGPFALEDSRTLDQLKDNPALSLNLDQALIRSYPTLEVTAEEAAALAMGKWLEPRGLHGVHAAVSPSGQAIALIKEQGKRLATVFVARPSTL